MNDDINFRYFTGEDAEEFTFYRIPKVLMTDEYFKDLSSDAKILYGLMLDRMGLSLKNGWKDAENRVFIYFSMEDTMEFLNCGKNKALSLLASLDAETGIGLIERVKQGQGKPMRVYVRNFVRSATGDVARFKNQTSRGLKSKRLDVYKSNPNKNKRNDNKESGITSDPIEQMPIDYEQMIKRNIAYDDLLYCHPNDAALITELYELILETVQTQNPTIVIAKNKYSAEFVRSRMLKLTASHIEYILFTLAESFSKVGNIKKYLLAMLFNASATMNGYYRTAVNHDMMEMAVRSSETQIQNDQLISG